MADNIGNYLQFADQITGQWDPQRFLTLQRLAQQTALQNQQLQAQNALRSTLSQPGAIDDKTGMPTPSALKSLWGVSPEAAVGVSGNMLQMQNRQVQLRANEAKINLAAAEQAQQMRKEANQVYEDTLKSQGPKAAQDAAQEVYDREMPKLAQLAGPDAQLEKSYDYQRASQRAHAYEVAHAKPITPAQQVQEQQRQEEIDIRRQEMRQKAESITPLHGEPGTYNVKGPDGSTTPMFLNPGKNPGTYFTQDGSALDTSKYQIINKAPASQIVSPEEAEARADLLGTYKAELSPYGMARLPPEVLKVLHEKYPNFDASKFPAAKRLREGYSQTTPNSPGGQMNAINTAIQHLEVFDDLGEALKNPSNSRAVNAVINYARTMGLGHPEVTNFNTAKDVIADEVVKAVTGAGGVYDRKQMQDAMSSNSPIQQLKGQKDAIERLMAGRVNSMEKQWTSSNLPDPEFQDKLLPATKDALENKIPARERASAAGRKADAGFEIGQRLVHDDGSYDEYIGGPHDSPDSWVWHPAPVK